MEKVNKTQDESILVPTLKVGALAGKSSTFSAVKSLASYPAIRKMRYIHMSRLSICITEAN